MAEAMQTVEGDWKQRADRAGARRTGTYLRSITSRVFDRVVEIVGTVGSNYFVAKLLEEGTGIYGPRNRWIEPRRARALRWPAGGSHASSISGARTFKAGPGFTLAGRVRSGRAGTPAGFVFARRVRGIVPRRFAHDASLATRGHVERIFEQGGRRIVARLNRRAG